ncbi:MAG TPA: cytochrome c, partial [Solimonas sp.]
LSSNAPLRSLAEQGAVVFREHGCSGCHERGSTVHAPQLEGLYGKTVMLQGGDHVIADDRYFRDSVLLPQKQIAAGYRPAMPSFAGQISEEDLAKLSAWFHAAGDEEDHVP